MTEQERGWRVILRDAWRNLTTPHELKIGRIAFNILVALMVGNLVTLLVIRHEDARRTDQQWLSIDSLKLTLFRLQNPYYPPPDQLYITGGRLPDLPEVTKRKNDLWASYINRRPVTFELIRRVYQYADRIEYLKELVRQYGLHEDFIYLIIHEAWLKDDATSWANARGACQFMKDTAIEQDLQIKLRSRNSAEIIYDERLSFPHCVKAAFNHLQSIQQMFYNDPHLAMAAYNAGGTTLKQAIREQNTKDYFSLRLPDETMNYVLRIAIEKELIENHLAYGFSTFGLKRVQTICTAQRELKLTKSETLLAIAQDSLGITYNQLRECNPQILLKNAQDRLPATSSRRPYVLNIPLR